MHKKTDVLLVWGFTAVLALFCVFLVWFVPTRAGLDFQLADIDKSLETSYGRERKQQQEAWSARLRYFAKWLMRPRKRTRL